MLAAAEAFNLWRLSMVALAAHLVLRPFLLFAALLGLTISRFPLKRLHLARLGALLFALIGLTLPAAIRAQTPEYHGGQSARSLITEGIDETRLMRLEGNTHPDAVAENDRGAVSDRLPMQGMQLVLKRPADREKALEHLMEEQQRKGSAQYHKWLTAKELGERFGPSAQDVEKVSGWLHLHGFQVESISPTGMFLSFSGTAGQVKETFHTEIHNVEMDGERHFANMSDPQIPAALAGVVAGPSSLHNFMPHSLMKKKPEFTFDCPAGTSSQGQTLCTTDAEFYAVTPADMATIYNLNPAFANGITGAGQTIVVIEDTLIANVSDVATFRSAFGLSSYRGTFSQITATGSSATCNSSGVNGDESEAALDAEWAGASAPNAAIVLASCADTQTVFGGLIALENLTSSVAPPQVVSISYGECEAGNTSVGNLSYVNAYQAAAAVGTSVFVSSGDEGAASCDANKSVATHGVAVSGFASTPYNVAVGGTDFADTYESIEGNPTVPVSTYWSPTNSSSFESALSYIPETPWDDSCANYLIYTANGYTQSYGSTGFCNSTTGKGYRTTGAGSGGPSAYEGPSTASPLGNKPSWQSVMGNPSDNTRDIPDVSLFSANGVWNHFLLYCLTDTAQGGGPCVYTNPGDAVWLAAGGTSFASPIMAGIQALINQYDGGSASGNPNPTYYNLGKIEYNNSTTAAACNSSLGTGIGSACVFNDVTLGDIVVNCKGTNAATDCTGSNGTSNSALQGELTTGTGNGIIAYGSNAGWDFSTGLGSVNVWNLIQDYELGPTTSVALSVNPNSSSSYQGQSVTFTATVTSPLGEVIDGQVTWSANTGCAVSPITNGIATCTTSALPLLANTVSATYVDCHHSTGGCTPTGLPSYQGSNTSVTQNVYLPATSFTVTAPSSTTGGSPLNVSVTALDQFGNLVSAYAGTVHFTSTDPGATLPADTTLTLGMGTLSATLVTPGSQTITATDTFSGATGTSGGIAVAAPYLVVTTANDDAATPGNCTEQTAPGTGTDLQCSLRDALAFATSTGSGIISFDGTAFASAQTILLTNGTLNVPSNTSVAGPTGGSGLGVANLVTVDGNASSTDFTVSAGVTGASLANLNIQNGAATQGAGISNNGGLTVTSSTISGNTASGNTQTGGAGIYNAGTLTLTASTIANNSATSGVGAEGGGGIANNGGTLTILNSTLTGNSAIGGANGVGGAIVMNGGTLTLGSSTITNNSADGGGGGIFFNSGSSTLAYDILSGNNSSTGPNTFGSFVNDGGNQIDVANILLAPLGSYGGPTQTMIPLPGSPAICGSVLGDGTLVPNQTADQRGNPIDTPCRSSYADAGSVQTHYANLHFTASNYTTYLNKAISPAVVVSLSESGNVIAGVPITVGFVGAGDASGLGPVTTVAGTGATFSNLAVDTASSTDTLSITLPITAAGNAVQLSQLGASAALNVMPLPTPTVSISLSASTVTLGTTVTITATVGGSAGTPTGSVRFFSDFQPLSLVPLTGGVATLQTSLLPVGVHTIAVSYTGDTNYSAANATPATLTVNQNTSAVSVGSSGSPAGVGSPVILTATVTGSSGTPTGNVGFYSGVSLIGTQALSGGVATLPISTLPTGIDTITAHYLGDGSYLPSISPNFTQVITKKATTVSLAPTPSPVSYGSTLTLSATVATTLTGVTPTGSVKFFDGYTLLGSGTLAGGVATYQTSALLIGTHSFIAEYAGDSNYVGVNGTGSATVIKLTTTVTLVPSPSPVTYGSPLTLTATMASTLAGVAPTGAVKFFDGYTLLGTGTVTGGVATYQTSALLGGKHSFIAEYVGDNIYIGVNGTATDTVAKLATTVAVTSSASPSTLGQSVTLTATINIGAGTANPTGGVNFYSNNTLLGAGVLSGNLATLTTSSLPHGVLTITAQFAGDGNYGGSKSPNFTQVVH
jgi:subtilase family serine protease